jgi:hypothetical protein
MTVCIAAICTWMVDDKGTGAIITASDRMITRRGESEYEPPQAKFLHLSKRTAVLFAGDITVHSEAIQKTRTALLDAPTDNVGEIAELYASFVRALREREATQMYLSPLGLTGDSLLSGTEGPLANKLREQVQGHTLDAEAMVVGTDNIGKGAHIYHVNGIGFVTCHDEVGFLAIGMGAGHAESQIMAFKYAPWWRYFDTVVVLYSAKKRAEVAPGVGPITDMYFIQDGGPELLRADVMKLVAELYDESLAQEEAQRAQQVTKLVEKFREGLKAAQAASPTTSSKDQT